MAASREAAKTEVSHQHRQNEVAICLDQPDLEGGYTPDPDVMATIMQLLLHL